MKSFILALLPGLEEETGEYFETVLSLLDRISGSVSPSFFFQNIWLVMLTTPSARGTSLNFLSRRLPKLKAEEGELVFASLLRIILTHVGGGRYHRHCWSRYWIDDSRLLVRIGG